MNKGLKILIATGIYPPAIGGPSQYAYEMKVNWEAKGHTVKVKTFSIEHYLPSGIRHIFYFLKIIPATISCDFIFALDTFSVGWPATCAAKIFGKKIIMRTGGDFLWENYVERTGDMVLLKDFYKDSRDKWSKKERLIFNITKWTIHNVHSLIFSTEWQRSIWSIPYDIGGKRTFIVENKYGNKEESFVPDKRDFIAGTRPLKWKNTEILKDVFSDEAIINSGAVLNSGNASYKSFMDTMSHAYAVILISLGDISPNMILDSIRFDKPFIVTTENGLMDRIKDISIVVDPKNKEDIKEKVLWLSDKENYDKQVNKIKNFNFTHTWDDIASEILSIYETDVASNKKS